MKDDRLMMMVSNSITREHSTGDLIVCWEKLNNEFSPKDISSKLDLYDSIRLTKLEFGRNPDHWYEDFNNKLNKLNVEFGEKMTDEELIHIILTNLPDEYDDLKMQFFRQRKSVVEPLTLDSMTSQLRDYHKYSKRIKDMKLKDLALNTVDFNKKESYKIKDKKINDSFQVNCNLKCAVHVEREGMKPRIAGRSCDVVCVVERVTRPKYVMTVIRVVFVGRRDM